MDQRRGVLVTTAYQRFRVRFQMANDNFLFSFSRKKNSVITRMKQFVGVAKMTSTVYEPEMCPADKATVFTKA